MYCLDASALVDYLDGVDAIGAFIGSNEREPIFAPTIALHEAFVGAARSHGETGLEDVREHLDWIEPVPLTVDGAAEAASIDAELHERGEPIGALDTLIGGVVRDAGGTIVTRDAHFEGIADLDVYRYDREFDDSSSKQ